MPEDVYLDWPEWWPGEWTDEDMDAFADEYQRDQIETARCEEAERTLEQRK